MTGDKKLSKIYLKKLLRQSVSVLLIFFIAIVTPVISSTQIACDVMSEHVIQ